MIAVGIASSGHLFKTGTETEFRRAYQEGSHKEGDKVGLSGDSIYGTLVELLIIFNH